MPQEKENASAQDVPVVEKPRRGRPPKSATTATTTETAPAPKRRGRPPKSATTETAAPKKKRGRPPKSATTAETAAPKKKRGRPPKSATATATAAATPKRRGRPPKSATATATAATPKRRGRPPKSATATETAAAPKKRGRPAGVTAAVALKNYKAEAKAQISALKEEIKLLKAELRAATQKEAKLLKLFEKKTAAVARFAEKWDKDELKKVFGSTRKKRARK